MPSMRGAGRKLCMRAIFIGLSMLAIIFGISGLTIWYFQLSTRHDELLGQGTFTEAAVSCDAPYCAEIGKSMLEKGGSVADAAIAALLCMGVVHSQSMGIGGGFLMVLYNGTTKTSRVLNARERAPAFATKDMFSGDSNKSQKGGLAVGIPGELLGYSELWKQHGKLSWKELFEPAIELARYGFNVSAHTANSLFNEWDAIKNVSSMTEVFLNPETGQKYTEGELLKLEKLADTLELIAQNSATEFYEGQVGRWFVEDLKELGGNITMDDLRNYKVEWSEPLKVQIHGNLTLLATPPPGSGVLMAFILKVLSGYHMNPKSIETEEDLVLNYQRIIESFKHAFAYRTQLGDPSDPTIADAVHELVRKLTSDEYASEIQKKITKAEGMTNNTYEFYGASLYTPDDHGTAHISVVTANGDAISITSTINTYFGARIRSKNTGIIYNNEMDDFANPGIVNYFNVPPSLNNLVRPGKRPLSSMTPAIFVDGNGKARLVIGTAGGTKIITATPLVSLRTLWFEEDIREAIDITRFHHQLYPMELDFELGFPLYLEDIFEQLGHKLQLSTLRSAVTAIAVTDNGLIAKVDRRKPGSVDGYHHPPFI